MQSMAHRLRVKSCSSRSASNALVASYERDRCIAVRGLQQGRAYLVDILTPTATEKPSIQDLPGNP